MASDYKQYNYNATYAGCSFSSQACGPTSCADLLNISPLTTAQWMTNNGYATTDCSGSYWTAPAACLTAFGGGGKQLNSGSLLGKTSSTVFTEWQNVIKGGCMGILLMGNGKSNYWTNSGHFIAIVQYNAKTDKYLVYDPASVARTGWHPFSDFSGNIKVCYTSTIKWGGAATSGGTADNSVLQVKFPQIQFGSTGEYVRILQKILCQRGMYNRKELDGSYGNNTKKAVKTYQQWIKDHGGKLAVDGVCGPNTWQSMLGMGTVNGDKLIVNLRQIKDGDKNTEVYLLQEILWSDNIYFSSVDWNYGPATRAAVLAVQKMHGIAQDGVCGPTTWKKVLGI